MFTKLANEIDFDEIESFCRKWSEGVRVEYKREIAHLSKIISSFANTQGGIFIIGVETDQNNKVKFPIQGIPNEGGTEERIIQSALTGIYPAVMPEVIIRDVPGVTDRVVIVVRVDESPQAPHALQNSNRVYVRVSSITQPYEFADAGIDRIEYLLKRREEPQRISRRILDRIEERVRVNSYSSQLERPNLAIFARPVFPYRPIIAPPEIYEYMVLHPSIPSTARNIDLSTKRVTGGACHVSIGDWLHFWELNEHGTIYYREGMHRKRMLSDYLRRVDDNLGEEYLSDEEIASKVYTFIGVAADFFTKCEYSGNVEVTARLEQVRGEKLLFSKDVHPAAVERRQSEESEIVVSTQCLPRDLRTAKEYSRVLIELLNQLYWVFNVGDNERTWREKWREYVKARVGK